MYNLWLQERAGARPLTGLGFIDPASTKQPALTKRKIEVEGVEAGRNVTLRPAAIDGER
jgi:hypothetical protein